LFGPKTLKSQEQTPRPKVDRIEQSDMSADTTKAIGPVAKISKIKRNDEEEKQHRANSSF